MVMARGDAEFHPATGEVETVERVSLGDVPQGIPVDWDVGRRTVDRAAI